MVKQRVCEVFFIFVLFAIVSCGSDDRIKVEEHTTFKRTDFKQTIALKGESIILDSLASPSRICVIPEKNLLIVADITGEYLAKVYTFDQFKFIKYFVKKGEGPNEQLSLFHLQYDSSADVIYATDFYKKRIFVYSIESLVDTSRSAQPLRNINMREGVLNKPAIISSNKIFDLRDNSQEETVHVLNVYNNKGHLLYEKGMYPSIDKKYEKSQLWEVFAAGLNRSVDGRKLIVNYFNTDYLEVYDTAGLLQKRIQGPDIIYPDFVSASVSGNGTVTQPTRKQRNAYTGIAKMEKNIFVLYDGESILRKSYNVTDLFCFSEDLVPMRSYILDIPIFLFDIDWKTNTLYGLTSEKEGSIIRYKL